MRNGSRSHLTILLISLVLLLCIGIASLSVFVAWLNNRPQYAETVGEPGDRLIVTSVQSGMDKAFVVVGLVRQHTSGGSLIAILGGATLEMEQVKPLLQSVDGIYLIGGAQAVHIPSWTLTSPPLGATKSVVGDTPQISSNLSPSGDLRFTIRTSAGETPLLFHDWDLLIYQLDAATPLTTYRGRGKVICAGWEATERAIYVETNAGIVSVRVP